MKASLEIKAYPEIGLEFELTLNGDRQASQPLAMVYNYGYHEKGWRYNGQAVTGLVTRTFKLVSVGRCVNWNELIGRAKALGRIPEGQWLEALLAAYPEYDNQGSVGVADNSWTDHYKRSRFPALSRGGQPFFYWADTNYDARWRWLVGQPIRASRVSSLHVFRP